MKIRSYTILKSIIIFLLVLKVISFGFLAQMTVAKTEPTKSPKSQQKIKPVASNEQILMGKGFFQPISSEKPLRIIIPRIHMDVAIKEAAVVNGSWEVSEITANHGAGSAYPGQKGNMVIFAHARENLFLPLREVLSGDEVYILTQKQWYVYTIEEITEVLPEQTEVINPTKEEQVTLFTCSGFDDEKRLIVVGKRKKDLVLH